MVAVKSYAAIVSKSAGTERNGCNTRARHEAANENAHQRAAMAPKPKVKIPPKYNDPEKSGIVQVVPRGGIKSLRFDLQ